jgi:predicted O-methyltransferase YrrM
MSRASIQVDDRLEHYLQDVNRPETPIQKRLRDETAKMSNAGMQIGANQGSFMAFLIGLTGVRNAIEIGTFTGYSALTVAAALPVGGKLVCCDVSAEWTRIGQKAWAEAGVADRIELKIGPAAETLKGMIDAGQAGQFDFAFIDADKENYETYYEQCLVLVRKGGLIAIDNTLWDGKVADPSDETASTVAIRKVNLKLRDDPRVDFCLIPVGDGIALARVL